MPALDRVMAAAGSSIAAKRLRHLVLLEGDPAERGFIARVARELKSNASYIGKILGDGRSSVGAEVIERATRRFGVSADYFFDPGPPDLDPSPYSRGRNRSRAPRAASRPPDPVLETIMAGADLDEPRRAVLRSIEWGAVRPNEATFRALCAALSFASAPERIDEDAPRQDGPQLLREAEERRRRGG